MKFRRTPQFIEDLSHLQEDDKTAVDEDAFRSVALALQGDTKRFKKHRIQLMEGKPGIWEGHLKQNLCFTFHYDYASDGEKICFFRRIGTHKIYKSP